MINLREYDLFVDERVSKNGKTYYGLFIRVNDSESLICFVNKSFYQFLNSLSA